MSGILQLAYDFHRLSNDVKLNLAAGLGVDITKYPELGPTPDCVSRPGIHQDLYIETYKHVIETTGTFEELRKRVTMAKKESEKTAHPFESLRFYAIQNSEGKWFRRKGYGGYGDTWTDSPTAARIYNKIGPAKGVITFFATRWKDYPVPKLVVITPGKVEVVDKEEKKKKTR